MRPHQQSTDSLILKQQAVTNTQTVTARLDTVGGDYASIRILFNSEVNTNAVGPTISLLHGDVTNTSSMTTVVADVSGVDLTAAAVATYHVDCAGKGRYLALNITTATATNDDITVGAVGSLFKEELPATTTDMADVARVV
jgi:hypothetical protein